MALLKQFSAIKSKNRLRALGVSVGPPEDEIFEKEQHFNLNFIMKNLKIYYDLCLLLQFLSSYRSPFYESMLHPFLKELSKQF